MTEGIIQKSIKYTLGKRLVKKHYSNTEMILAFKALQYELIEKIKQNIVVDSFDKELDCVLLSDLIGDNQE